MDDQAFGRHSIAIESSRAASGAASEWARALAAQAGLPEDRIYALDLCIVEIVSNIVDHGYGGGPGRIWLELDVSPSAATITFLDQAPAFDPLSIPAPAMADSIEEAQIGGFGIHFVRTSASACQYARRDGKNVFEVRF